MNIAYEYHLGKFTEIELPEWGEESLEAYIGRMGYRELPVEVFANEPTHGILDYSVNIYKHDKDIDKYIVEVPIAGESKLVLIQDFPSLMDFIRHYTPALTLRFIRVC